MQLDKKICTRRIQSLHFGATAESTFGFIDASVVLAVNKTNSKSTFGDHEESIFWLFIDAFVVLAVSLIYSTRLSS
jgi:hypothetical protein